MNEMIVILEELKKIQDQISELSTRIGELDYEMRLTNCHIRDIRRIVCPANSNIDKYPDDTYLDKLEAEEHEKVMCTYLKFLKIIRVVCNKYRFNNNKKVIVWKH